jgi:Ca2+:H+ antiporter
MSNENEPLLGGGHHDESTAPTFWSSFKVTLFSSYINYFLIFVPIAIIFSLLDASATVVFTLNFIAIIPLAKLLGFGKSAASIKEDARYTKIIP